MKKSIASHFNIPVKKIDYSVPKDMLIKPAYLSEAMWKKHLGKFGFNSDEIDSLAKLGHRPRKRDLIEFEKKLFTEANAITNDQLGTCRFKKLFGDVPLKQWKIEHKWEGRSRVFLLYSMPYHVVALAYLYVYKSHSDFRGERLLIKKLGLERYKAELFIHLIKHFYQKKGNDADWEFILVSIFDFIKKWPFFDNRHLQPKKLKAFLSCIQIEKNKRFPKGPSHTFDDLKHTWALIGKLDEYNNSSYNDEIEFLLTFDALIKLRFDEADEIAQIRLLRKLKTYYSKRQSKFEATLRHTKHFKHINSVIFTSVCSNASFF